MATFAIVARLDNHVRVGNHTYIQMNLCSDSGSFIHMNVQMNECTFTHVHIHPYPHSHKWISEQMNDDMNDWRNIYSFIHLYEHSVMCMSVQMKRWMNEKRFVNEWFCVILRNDCATMRYFDWGGKLYLQGRLLYSHWKIERNYEHPQQRFPHIKPNHWVTTPLLLSWCTNLHSK